MVLYIIMEIIMGHVTNQYYEIMQKTGMASIVALTTKKNPFPQEKVNYLLITGQMKYDSSEYATLKEKIQMAGYAVILVVEAAQIQIANRLLWECRNVTPDARILEVGIGSGMIAMQLAPCCKTYSGCDISKIVLDKLDGMAKERKMNNLRLYPYAADEIYHIREKFDIILMSSVTERNLWRIPRRSATEKRRTTSCCSATAVPVNPRASRRSLTSSIRRACA